ncbi:MAG: twitching motility protein PilT [Clostridiales bacterium]|nr:twitching motility protein PilT [Clostridiales bacterium]
MVHVLTGDKGAGKTKKLITMANDFVQEAKGHVVYVSNSSEGMYQLSSKIRLVDISEFPISSYESFMGFLYGMISEDYDIETIFIDNLNAIISNDDVMRFFSDAKNFTEKTSVKFVVGAKCEQVSHEGLNVEYMAV